MHTHVTETYIYTLEFGCACMCEHACRFVLKDLGLCDSVRLVLNFCNWEYKACKMLYLLGWVYSQSAVDSKANLSRRCCGNSPVIRNNSNQSSASVIEPRISNDNLLFLLWFRGFVARGIDYVINEGPSAAF